MSWKVWKFRALERLERGEAMFKTYAKPGCQALARRRFVAEMLDEYMIERTPRGPALTDVGRDVLARWRVASRQLPKPRKYDPRQLAVILTTPTEPGCIGTLAERFATTPYAIAKYRYRLKVAARERLGQADQPLNSPG